MGKAVTRNHCKNGLYEGARDGAYTKPAKNVIVIGKRVRRNIPVADIVEQMRLVENSCM